MLKTKRSGNIACGIFLAALGLAAAWASLDIDELLQRVSNLSLDLRPAMLDDLGAGRRLGVEFNTQGLTHFHGAKLEAALAGGAPRPNALLRRGI